jgi:hypothetical protein
VPLVVIVVVVLAGHGLSLRLRWGVPLSHVREVLQEPIR